MGKNKRRRVWGINSSSSQFRVTPQLIVQVHWSQVSSSNRRPLGITAVTEQHRPPSFSSVFSQLLRSLNNLCFPTEEFIKAKHDSAAHRANVFEVLQHSGFIFASLTNFILKLSHCS